MRNKKYEFIVIGSGAGGATVARELAKKGKDVLIIERGKKEKKVGGLFNSLRYFDVNKFTKWPLTSKEGVPLYRAIMAGGTTMVSCGNGIRSYEEELATFGIDLKEEYEEAETEMEIAPFDLDFLSKGSQKILEASKKLGYKMEPTPKFINSRACARCATCYMGCHYNAKWTSLKYLNEAIKNGAEIMYQSTVDGILIEKDKVVGVKGKTPKTKFEIFADTVILSAGAIATAMILQKTGIKEAGSNFYGHLIVNTYGITKELSQLDEPSMAIYDKEFIRSKGFLLSTWPQPSRLYRFVEGGIRGSLLPPGRTLGIMTKSSDEPVGRVYSDGSITKPVTDSDMARLKEGSKIAKEILLKVGIKKKNIVVGKPFGAHPGGTAVIGEVVDKNLKTKVDNLFVCDTSVLPSFPVSAPILTVVALAKRLVKRIAS